MNNSSHSVTTWASWSLCIVYFELISLAVAVILALFERDWESQRGSLPKVLVPGHYGRSLRLFLEHALRATHAVPAGDQGPAGTASATSALENEITQNRLLSVLVQTSSAFAFVSLLFFPIQQKLGMCGREGQRRREAPALHSSRRASVSSYTHRSYSYCCLRCVPDFKHE